MLFKLQSHNFNQQNMNWTSFGDRNRLMIDNMKANKLITNARVAEAMLNTERGVYCQSFSSGDLISDAVYDPNRSINLTSNNGVAPAPSFIAAVLQSACDCLSEDSDVLVIEDLSGYLSACIGQMLKPYGRLWNVVSLNARQLDALAETIKRDHPEFIEDNNIRLASTTKSDVVVDHPQCVIYDVIVLHKQLTCAPNKLLKQLNSHGMLIAPILQANGDVHLMAYSKVNDAFEQQCLSTNVCSIDRLGFSEIDRSLCSSPEMASNINQLWDDILLLIFDYLPRNQWSSIAQTCARWYALIDRCYRSMDSISICDLAQVQKKLAVMMPVREYSQNITPYLSPTHVSLLPNHHNVRELRLNCAAKVPLNTIYTILRIMAKLKVLDLSGAFVEIHKDQQYQEVQGVINENLAELYMDKCYQESVIAHFDLATVDSIQHRIHSCVPNITSLSLEFNMLLNGTCLLGVATKLCALKLDMCRRIDSEHLCLALQAFTSLQSLSLYGNHKLDGYILAHIPRTVTNIDLSYCNGLDAVSMAELFEARKDIFVEVHLDHVKHLNDTVLLSVSQCIHLHTLTVNQYFRDDGQSLAPGMAHSTEHLDKALEKLSNLSHLKHLEIRRNDFITDDVMRKLSLGIGSSLEFLNATKCYQCTTNGFAHMNNFTGLKHLELFGNESITAELMLSLGFSCPKLEFLDLRYCFGVTYADMDKLVKQWPREGTVFQLSW